jgi:hypothetical protein
VTDPAATDGVIFAVPAEALEPLGAHRLAQLLSELAEIDERVARRARLEIADLSGPAAVAETVTAQMERLARDTTFFDWREVGELARDVDMLRDAITTKITPSDPELGLAMLWRLMALAGPIHERAHDHGEIGAVFDEACHDIGRAAVAAGCAPDALSARVVEALQAGTHGEFSMLLSAVEPVLGPEGVARVQRASRERCRT